MKFADRWFVCNPCGRWVTGHQCRMTSVDTFLNFSQVSQAGLAWAAGAPVSVIYCNCSFSFLSSNSRITWNMENMNHSATSEETHSFLVE